MKLQKRETFSYKRCGEPKYVKAKASNLRVRFKTLVETANAISGMQVTRAQQYLKNVLGHKECVPFKKFSGGIGKCAQAKQFKTVSGRWPSKAVKSMNELLINATSNAYYSGIDPEDLFVCHIEVNPAPVSSRRTFRAHGKINPHVSHLSHIQIVLKLED
ncbi:unnamed protein product [Ceutorhynchus assimilis]|uniref:Large ribosomal subunit protein uL22 n=1 Tax=Ceutorhynchus assimilis TaxID=467358 RepID=A0A9N9MIV8_9CUCU|nr:unnamed protein product [Ceutorhynchus assimilis]